MRENVIEERLCLGVTVKVSTKTFGVQTGKVVGMGSDQICVETGRWRVWVPRIKILWVY